MDSSVNINAEIINFKQYLLSNTDTLRDILSKLETISVKSREAFKSALTKDNRIDNQLLEINQSKIQAVRNYICGTFKCNSQFWVAVLLFHYPKSTAKLKNKL